MPQVRKRTSVKKTPPKLKREKFPYLKDFPRLEPPISEGKLRVPSPKKKMESPYIKEFGAKKHKSTVENVENLEPIVENKPRAYSPNKIHQIKKNDEEVKAQVYPQEDFHAYTVKQLKEMLKNRKLPVSGNKPALIARLEEDNTQSGNPKMDNRKKSGKMNVPTKQEKLGSDFSRLKVVELKAELKKRHLPVSGNKATLVARLEESEGEVKRSEEEAGFERKSTKSRKEATKSGRERKSTKKKATKTNGKEKSGKVKNPDTGRMIAVGGATYKKLVREGKI